MNLTEIHFFQFDNLVQNRIPFVLLHEPFDFSALYPRSLERNHLEKWSFEVNFSEAPTALSSRLAEKGLPSQLPIIMVAKSHQDLSSWIKNLEEQGFINLFYVAGGWVHLTYESKQELN